MAGLHDALQKLDKDGDGKLTISELLSMTGKQVKKATKVCVSVCVSLCVYVCTCVRVCVDRYIDMYIYIHMQTYIRKPVYRGCKKSTRTASCIKWQIRRTPPGRCSRP